LGGSRDVQAAKEGNGGGFLNRCKGTRKGRWITSGRGKSELIEPARTRDVPSEVVLVPPSPRLRLALQPRPFPPSFDFQLSKSTIRVDIRKGFYSALSMPLRFVLSSTPPLSPSIPIPKALPSFPLPNLSPCPLSARRFPLPAPPSCPAVSNPADTP
jgi:hypothetical protein